MKHDRKRIVAIMDMIGIAEDAVKYPLSDLKKVLILGIIILFTSMPGISIIAALLGTSDLSIIRFLDILYLLVYGYLFRIIKSSLNGIIELPDFDNWTEMFKDGIKVFIVSIIYSTPALFIILAFAVVPFASNFGITGSNISTVVNMLLQTAGAWAFIAILYMILIIPIILIAVTNMAYNKSELNAAFKFHTIINIIEQIGQKQIIKWYILVGAIYIIIYLLGSIITTIFSILLYPLVEQVLTSLIIGQLLTLLIVSPYLKMYFARSIASFYVS